MRLIDADAYSAEMKDRQDAAWKWRNEAIAEEDELKLARAEGAFTAFTEAKLTMDKHIINPWHRVEDELPEIGHSILIWAGGVAMIGKRTDDDMFKGKRYFLIEADGYNYWERVEPGMYWMPIEPLQEDADGNK